jgi:hypothetical protein
MEEPAMTGIADLLPTASSLQKKLELAKQRKADAELQRLEEEKAEKQALIDQLSKPSGVSDEEGVKRGLTIIRRAVDSGLKEVEVYRFPNALCTDRGRAINQMEEGWEETLTSVPREIYLLWRKYFKPRGYKLKVQIVNFPRGVPGDVGMSLSWE